MNELEESKLRSKVMLLLFHHRKPTRIKRIINKFIKCMDSHRFVETNSDSNDESNDESMDSHRFVETNGESKRSKSNGNGQV
jgi:hypothetical protein